MMPESPNAETEVIEFKKSHWCMDEGQYPHAPLILKNAPNVELRLLGSHGLK